MQIPTWQNWGDLQVKPEFSIQNWGKLQVKLEFCHVDCLHDLVLKPPVLICVLDDLVSLHQYLIPQHQ